MIQEKNDEMNDEMIIGKLKIPVRTCEINQTELKFYEANPRIYNHSLHSQEEIEDYMSDLEHVKQLRVSIEMNGGLIDPVIVRDGDFTVLEGNSRLAAYRLLANKDPIGWAKIKCKILPKDIDDKIIFQLLGQYHIIGRKDWDPFEQASYLYRRLEETKIPIETMAKELGIQLSLAKKMVNTIKFMFEHSDTNKKHWSYYEEYLKNSGIKKYRETNDDIDKTIVEAIQKDEITDAKDIRGLGKIASGKDKFSKRLMKQIINKEIDIYTGYDELKNSGKLEDVRKKIVDFRQFISRKGIEKTLFEKIEKGELSFEIKNIYRNILKIKEMLEKQ